MGGGGSTPLQCARVSRGRCRGVDRSRRARRTACIAHVDSTAIDAVLHVSAITLLLQHLPAGALTSRACSERCERRGRRRLTSKGSIRLDDSCMDVAVLRGWHVRAIAAAPAVRSQGDAFYMHLSWERRLGASLDDMIARAVEALS